MQQIASNKIFDGHQLQYRHSSSSLGCEMVFSVFLPPQAESEKVPILYWLSGLTCTDQNFVTKAGAQQYASQYGIAIVCPDTSPRGDEVPDDPDGGWDFGLGAGFYVNATQTPWSQHYRMYDYVTEELPELVNNNFSVDPARSGVFGHSMGGHGALVIALRNADRFRSVSAFSPIVAPSRCAWGQKAFSGYLGNDKTLWTTYDACALIQQAETRLPVLIDQGDADEFLEQQLKTDLLIEAASQVNYPVDVRFQSGYDHSYFFIATFVGEHVAFHAKHL